VEIRPGTFVISTECFGRQLNLFLLRGDFLLLFDTGTAGMPNDLLFPYMHEHGLALEQLLQVANSHAHADHIGGNAEIRSACPAVRVGAHELDIPWIEDPVLLCKEHYERYPHMDVFGPQLRQLILDYCGGGSPVDIAWRGGETIDLGNRKLEVIHAAGHTPGNIVLLNHYEGILFEAETILGGATGKAGKRGVPYYYDVPVYRATLRHLAALPWHMLLSSHSEPRDRTAGLRAIRESLDFVEEFGRQVLTVLTSQRGPATFATIVRAMGDNYGYVLDLGLALLVETHLSYEARTKRATLLPDGRWAAT
jgi:glyoxylase-like metal-dependent hydrolase (beta-lactamase superfamily II)